MNLTEKAFVRTSLMIMMRNDDGLHRVAHNMYMFHISLLGVAAEYLDEDSIDQMHLVCFNKKWLVVYDKENGMFTVSYVNED